jgi:hypothetical protein
MTSAIDATKPVTGSPTTQSVRDNFATAKTEISALQAAVDVINVSTWVGLGVCTYETADGPTFQFSISADVTGIIGVGHRVKLTQTTVKYFIVTAVGAFTAGKTIITIYGGTDYVLANAPITLPYFSMQRCPIGFPLLKSKWRVLVTDTAVRSQSSPVVNTKYNLGGLQISVPIGAWNLGYRVYAEAIGSILQWAEMAATLSTANNSETNVALTSNFRLLTGLTTSYHGMPLAANDEILVVAKTTYYLNAWAWIAAQASINFYGGSTTQTRIYAECAYL